MQIGQLCWEFFTLAIIPGSSYTHRAQLKYTYAKSQFSRGHVNNIPTLRFFHWLSVTEYVWDYQNNALRDTHQHAKLGY